MPKLVISDKFSKKMRWDARRKCYVGWQIDVYVNQGAGKRPKRVRETYPSETAAKDAENRLKVKSSNIKAGIEQPENARVRLTDIFDRRLAKLDNHREKVRAERVFRKFLDANEDLEFADELAAAHFNRFIALREGDASRSGGTVKTSTVLRELSPIRAALREARKFWRELSDLRIPPYDAPKYKKRPRQTNITENQKDLICASILSDRLENERSVRTESRPALAAMFALGWYLGLRFGEAKKLLKTDFNEKERTLRVYRSKTNDLTLFEFLPDEVLKILREACAESPSEFIFHLPCSEHTLNDIIKKACENNKLPFGRDILDGITFHSNRHSFTTRLVKATDIATAQSLTAHSNAAMVAYYSHASDDSKKNAMEKLYGGKEILTREKLQEIYERVRAGKMDFEKFLTEISLQNPKD